MKNYDYTQDGYYFVTICTYKQKPNIAEHKDVVKQILFSLPERFSGLNIDWYVLMPTHIHVIFVFEGMNMENNPLVERIKFEEFYKNGSDESPLQELWVKQPNF